MATLRKISSQILVGLLIGCALVQLTQGFTIGDYPKRKLAGWNKLPGFKARITQKGLDFFRDVGMQKLLKRIPKMHIPNQHGSAGPFTYNATNIKIVSFGYLLASISPNTGSRDGLTLRLRKGSFFLRGDLSCDFELTYYGNFDAHLADISLDVTIRIGVDSAGRPTASAEYCSFHVGYVSVNLNAGMAWLFDDTVADQFKQTLYRQICSIIHKAINHFGDYLRTRKVTMPYKDMFKFDYSLVESPTFNGSVDTAHKGEAYPIGSMAECPIPIPGIPQDSDRTSKMLFLWVTDYLPNSAGYVLQETGHLQHTVTPENVPPEQKKYLNTSSMAIKVLIPQISKMYPNMAMWIDLNSTKTPAVKITPSGIEAVLIADCSPYAVQPNKTKTFLFTLSVTITADLTVGTKGNNITWVVSSIRTALKEARSKVGPISISKLQRAVDMAIKMSILPKINRMGVAGVPLPKMDGFEMTNTSITPGLGFLKIGTDLIHTHKSANAA